MIPRQEAESMGDDLDQPAPAPAGFDPERDLPSKGAKTGSWRWDGRYCHWRAKDGRGVVVRRFTKAGLWLGRHYADGTEADRASALLSLERNLLFP